ncbi:T9SS type A sorting domain-containing protein [Salinibacter ruber]|uniref:T9SS type A sorting domain-containing protein n=1 Tax=Salinibacter ruber TaxID=146919 RepID=UPI00216938E6|nr:T9SS type A sorting domain-containing protein [Salinibacter ruber]MCS3785442.1 hypothetical protein [Salinibacter ruber]
MPLSMDPSDTDVGVSDAASADDTSTADPGDAVPETADMTSQNPTASAMNPSRLLRTALFSVLGLLLTGGLMAAQAQDDIFVDDGGNDSQAGDANNPVRTISEAVNRVDQDGDRIIVRGGDFTGEGAIAINRPITIEFAGAGDGATAARFDANVTFNAGRGETVDIVSSGGSFDLNGGITLTLLPGQVDIDASSTVSLAGGSTVVLGQDGGGAGSIAGSAPTFEGDLNVDYDLSANATITSGLEIPSDGDLGAGDLDVLDGTVNFDRDVSANSITVNSSGSSPEANFQSNDLTVTESGQADVQSGGTLNVGGTLTVNGVADPDANIVTGDGTVDVGTLNAVLDGDASNANNGSDETFEVSINPSGSDSDFAISDVTVDASASGDADELVVGVDFGSSGELDLTSGTAFEAVDTGTGTLNVRGGLTANGGVTNTGGTINVTGSPTFVGAIDNTSSGQIDVSSGNTLTVETGGSNVTHNGDPNNNNNDDGFTGGGTVDFVSADGNAHTIQGANFAVGTTATNASVTFSDENTIVTGEFDANSTVTIDGGNTLQLNGLADFQGGTLNDGSSSSNTLLFGGTTSADFFPGDTFDFDGDITFGKTSTSSSPAVTLKNSIRIGGNVELQHSDLPGTTEDDAIDLEDNDIFLDGGTSTFTNGGDPGENEFAGTGRVVFENSGSQETSVDPSGSTVTIAGDGGYGNIAVANTATSNDLHLPEGQTITFYGTLELIKEGVQITNDNNNGNNTVLNPAPGAEVRRVVDGAGTDIGQNTSINTTNFGGAATPSSDAIFNNAGNTYALTYGQSGGNSTVDDVSSNPGTIDNVGSEFGSNVGDLAVEEDAGVELTSNKSISGALEINGQLASTDGNGAALTLTGDDENHIVAGALNDAETNATTGEVTLVVDASNAIINGFPSGSSAPQPEDDALLGDVEVNDGASVTISGVKKIKGELRDASGASSTSVTLGLTGDQNLGDNDLLQNSPTQAVTGIVDFPNAGSFSITSNVDAYGDVDVGSNSVSFGDNNLTVKDSDFDGESGAGYSAGDGFLVMEDNGAIRTFTADGSTIPNLRVTSINRTPSNLELEGTSDGQGVVVDVGSSLDIENTISLNSSSNDRTVTFAGESTLDVGTATADNSGQSVVLEAQGSDAAIGIAQTTTVTDLNVAAGSGNTVPITTQITSFGPSTNDLTVSSNFGLFSGALNHGDANINVSGDGNFTVGADASSIDGNAGAYFKLNNSDLTPVLGSSLTIDQLGVPSNFALDGDEESITVDQEILFAGGQFDANIANNADELRLADGATIVRAATGDAFAETPTFEGDVNLEYQGGNNYTTDLEVPDASADAEVVNLTINNSTGEVDFRAGVNTNGSTVATGNVVVSGTVDLKEGDLVHNLGGVSGSRALELSNGATFAQRDGVIPSSTSIGGNKVNVGAITASEYTLVYRPDDSDLNTGGEEFLSGGAVTTLQIESVPANEGASPSSQDVLIGQNRTVGSLEVDRRSGSLDLNGSTLTVTEGVDISSGGVTGETLNAQGDVTVGESGSTEGATLRFAADSGQSFTLNGDRKVEGIQLNQTTSGTEVPTVEVTGGDLTVDEDASTDEPLVLTNGLLQIEDGNVLDLTESGFNRDVADGDTSHVVGSVSRTVSRANSVAEYPVGSSNASYRPFGFIFTEAPTQATDITVTHVDENPGETGNLPITDNENVTVGENYPDYYWTTESSNRLSISGEYEAFAQAEGLPFPDQSAQDFRIIQRASSGNDWSLVGDGTGYDNTPISESEGRVDISTVGATADIRQSPTRFTVGVPTEAAAGFQLAGSVTYPVVNDGSLTGGRAISGATVEASSSDTTVTVTTDSDGNYSFSQLPAGDYDVEASVSETVENVSTADALRAVRGFAGIDAFAGSFQEQVADVNGSGGVNATDALQIARFDLGLTDGFEVGPFVSETESVTLESDGVSGVEIFAAEAGDVRLDGGETGGSSQTLAASTLSPEQGLSAARTQSASNGASEAAVEAGETFEVPVRMGRGAEVGAYQMTVNYDSDIASFDGVKAAQEGVLTNASEDGTVQVSWFDQSGESALELRDGSDLVTLQFTASEDAAETDFSPEVKSGEITGPDAAPISAGVELQAVSIGAPAPDEFALNGSYPNPVQGQATIEMDIPSKASVTIEVYNVLGQRVQTMEQSMSAGSGQTIQLDGSNLASGQYFYRVEADLEDGSAQKSGRITVVK